MLSTIEKLAGKTRPAETAGGRYAADLFLRLPARLVRFRRIPDGKAEPSMVKEELTVRAAEHVRAHSER
jgi:hypothetical protein